MCDQKCECIPLQLIKSLQKKKAVDEIDLQGCNIEHLTQLSQIKSEISKLYLASNRIQILDSLPTSLTLLDISNNSITNLEALQILRNLKILRCGNNLIENFEISLPFLQTLDVSNNYLEKLPTSIPNVIVLNMFANQFKNYEREALLKYSKLQILDGIMLRQSYEQDHIIKIQEQQLAQKFQMNIDYLNKWRQELFKQLVQNKQYKFLVNLHMTSIQQRIIQFGSIKYVSQMEKKAKQLQQLQSKLVKCSNKLKRDKQSKQYEQQLIMHSIRNLIEDSNEDDKLDILIKKCSQFIQNIKLKNQQMQFQIDLVNQENELLKAQADHFMQMYNQLKQLNQRNEDPNNQEKNKGFSQLYSQIRTLEEEKQKLQMELNNCKERQNLEILQCKGPLEQQIALLSQEISFYKQKLNIQQEEIKIRIEQITQQFEKKILLQESEHQSQCDKIRYDQQQIIDSYIQKEQNKNFDFLKLKDIQHDLEQQIKQQKQDADHNQKEYQNQIKELQLQVRQQKDKINDQDNLLQQLKAEYQKQLDEMEKQMQLLQSDHTEMQNQLQKTIFDQSNEIQELLMWKKQSTQQNNELQKVIEMKDGVIRQLTLQQAKKPDQRTQTFPEQKISTYYEQSQSKNQFINAHTDLERKALEILQDDEF